MVDDLYEVGLAVNLFVSELVELLFVAYVVSVVSDLLKAVIANELCRLFEESYSP